MVRHPDFSRLGAFCASGCLAATPALPLGPLKPTGYFCWRGLRRGTDGRFTPPIPSACRADSAPREPAVSWTRLCWTALMSPRSAAAQTTTTSRAPGYQRLRFLIAALTIGIR